MFSLNRHTRSLARAASLLIASTALGVGSAQATEPVHMPLVLTAYTNGVGGTNILQNKYDEALVEIRQFKAQSSSAANAKANNLCVALTATRQLAEARSACNAALRAVRYEQLWAGGATGRLDNAELAAAYSNRAVVHALSKDMASARADLETARFLAPKADFVARNLASAQLEIATR